MLKRKTNNCSIIDKGQAMLEYALLSSLVVVAGIAFYTVSGWFEGIQNFLADLLLGISLPFP